MPVSRDPCLVAPVPVPAPVLDPAHGRDDAVTAARVRVPTAVADTVFRPLMAGSLPLWWMGEVALGHAVARDVIHRMGEGAELRAVAVAGRAEVQS